MSVLYISLIVGCALVAVFFAVRARSAEAERRIVADELQRVRLEAEDLRERLKNAEISLARAEEQRTAVEKTVEKMRETFSALSDEALKSNNRAFLEMARSSLEAVLAEAKGEIGKKEREIESLVRPLSDALKRYEEHIRVLEKDRERQYTDLAAHLRSLNDDQRKLRDETRNLVTALRTPQVKGRWGELQLRRVVELAGMSAWCDFTEQVSRKDDSGSIFRPDLIVHLPGGGDIVVDAKVSTDAYIAAFEQQSEGEREELFLKHARQMREHLRKLSEKSYWRQFEKSPEFVVMFIPGEPFLAKAAEYDRSLLEDGFANQVIMATPSTLIALLKAVAFGWRQEELTENARKISELGRELYDRLKTMAGHMSYLGDNIRKTVDTYNKMVGSFESRVLSAGRKFSDFGISVDKEIPPQDVVDVVPRSIKAAGGQPEDE